MWRPGREAEAHALQGAAAPVEHALPGDDRHAAAHARCAQADPDDAARAAARRGRVDGRAVARPSGNELVVFATAYGATHQYLGGNPAGGAIYTSTGPPITPNLWAFFTRHPMP